MASDTPVTAESLVTSTAVLGSAIVGLSAVIAAIVKIRAWVIAPFDGLEEKIKTTKTALETDIGVVKKSVTALEVHFDPNGGDLANKIKSIEARMLTLESTTSTERNDLRLVVKEVRDILTDLRDGKKEGA